MKNACRWLSDSELPNLSRAIVLSRIHVENGISIAISTAILDLLDAHRVLKIFEFNYNSRPYV